MNWEEEQTTMPDNRSKTRPSPQPLAQPASPQHGRQQHSSFLLENQINRERKDAEARIHK
jgi:hypothetical protein